MKKLAYKLLLAFAFMLLGAACVIVYVYSRVLEQFPDLEPWHTVELTKDFRAGMRTETLADYLAVEADTFTELERMVIDHVPAEEQQAFNRFHRGSRSDPAALPVNWNRTFLLEVAQPRGAVLLLHGLSDSPYSLRAIGEQLHQQGWLVLGLRMPGHGTAPASLRDLDIDDLRAATSLAVRHLRGRIGTHLPLLVVGYSNGAALATDYVLAARADATLSRVDGMVLLSPAFGLSPLAALAIWQARISDLPGLDKLAWQTVLPEFDPYKYNSFAVRAGDQIYRLTEKTNNTLAALGAAGPVEGFPPILVFQSVIDATVRADAVVDRVLDRLAENGSELVLYDMNRRADAAPFLKANSADWSQRLMERTTRKYAVTLLTNEKANSTRVHALTRPANSGETIERSLDLSWPAGVFALAHVSLPFAPDDPVYGVGDSPGRLSIGRVELRGETGALVLPASLVIRLRYNPFFSWQTERILAFAERIHEHAAGAN